MNGAKDQDASAPPQDRSGIDRLGVIASTTCAIHCAFTALLPGVLVALGLGVVIGHEAEWAFTITALLFACGALAISWRRHRSPVVGVMFGVGIAGLLIARFVEEAGVTGLGTGLAVLGGLALVIGHVTNIRASAKPAPSSP